MIENITIFRKRAGLTQGELASRIGISTGALCAYEKDESKMPISAFVLLCRELNIGDEEERRIARRLMPYSDYNSIYNKPINKNQK